ncbi:MAG: peptide deformylase, partial [Candidatus Paceibacterota bacterium]
MSLLKLELYPSTVLRNKNKKIPKLTPEIKKLISNMIQTMYHEEGVGLAAPQVGANLQLTVIDVTEKQNKPLVLINPTIVET